VPAKTAIFVPAYNNNQKPLGYFYIFKFRLLEAYCNGQQSTMHDVASAILHTNTDITQTIGYIGLKFNYSPLKDYQIESENVRPLTLLAVGYPSTFKNGQEMWADEGDIFFVVPNVSIVKHLELTAENRGLSGGPWLIKEELGYAIGLNCGGDNFQDELKAVSPMFTDIHKALFKNFINVPGLPV